MKVILKRKREKKGYGCKRYKNLPEKEKQKLDEYKKNITKRKKRRFIIIMINQFPLKNLFFCWGWDR